MNKSLSGTVQWVCMCIFAAGIAELVNSGYTIDYEFADYSLLMEVEANAKRFLYTPSSLRKAGLEQLQKFVQDTFQKEHAAYIATEKKMCSKILNIGEELIDRTTC